MIYTKLHEIPARLFFEIVETGNFYLLDAENTIQKLENQLAEKDANAESISTSILIKAKELEDIWTSLEDEDNRLSNNKTANRFLEVSKQIESLRCKKEKTEVILNYLRILPDEELEEILINDGYEIGENKEESFARIERLNKDIDVQIDRLENQLPKPKTPQPNQQKTSFEEIIIGYASIVGQTYKTSEITQSEFRALEKIVNAKIEAQKKNGRKGQNS